MAFQIQIDIFVFVLLVWLRDHINKEEFRGMKGHYRIAGIFSMCLCSAECSVTFEKENLYVLYWVRFCETKSLHSANVYWNVDLRVLLLVPILKAYTFVTACWERVKKIVW